MQKNPRDKNTEPISSHVAPEIKKKLKNIAYNEEKTESLVIAEQLEKSWREDND